jgi:twitching motility protein PilT
MVGEMRDLETIETALRAAETGHLVMSTLHTRSASDTILRIIDAFPVDQQAMVRTQLASSLNMVISQNLVKSAKGGRVMVSEVMILSHAMKHLIRDNRVHQIDSAIETAKGQGCRLLDAHLSELVLNGTIKEEVALDRATDPVNLKKRLDELREPS